MIYKQTIQKSYYLLNLLFLTLLMGLILGFAFIVVAKGFGSRSVTYLLICFYCIAVLGPIMHRIYYRTFDIAEPGIWFILYYFTHFAIYAIYILIFGSKVLNLMPGAKSLSLPNIALGIGLFGILSFWLGYSINFGKAIAHSLPILYRKWNEKLILPTGLICISLGWGLRLFLIFLEAGSIGKWIQANKYILLAHAEGLEYINDLSSLATIVLLLLFIGGRLSGKRRFWLLFGLFLVFDIAFCLLSGSRGAIAFLLLRLLICYYMTSEIHAICFNY